MSTTTNLKGFEEDELLSEDRGCCLFPDWFYLFDNLKDVETESLTSWISYTGVCCFLMDSKSASHISVVTLSAKASLTLL